MAGFSVLCRILLACVFFSLAGCLPNAKSTSGQGLSENNANTQPLASGDAINGNLKQDDVVSPIELSLLTQAERAFREARYTTPMHDNAYDKFQSVLLINPDNRQARAGLQAILLRYAHLVRNAISDRRLVSARNFLNKAKAYYPDNKLLADLQEQIRQARATLLAKPNNAGVKNKVKPKKTWVDEVLLSPEQLKAKSNELIAVLNDVALRLKNSNESVHIFARNDREGRWIYKQLKKAANGYRIRGDIRIAKKPKLRILPPL